MEILRDSQNEVNEAQRQEQREALMGSERGCYTPCKKKKQ